MKKATMGWPISIIIQLAVADRFLEEGTIPSITSLRDSFLRFNFLISTSSTRGLFCNLPISSSSAECSRRSLAIRISSISHFIKWTSLINIRSRDYESIYDDSIKMKKYQDPDTYFSVTTFGTQKNINCKIYRKNLNLPIYQRRAKLREIRCGVMMRPKLHSPTGQLLYFSLGVRGSI